MFQLYTAHSKLNSILKKEFPVDRFIPIKYHLDSSTVVTKDEWLIKVIRIEGFAFETADDEDVDIHKNIRNQLFKGISSGACALYTHIIRSRQDVLSDKFAMKRISNYFADYLNMTWRERHSAKRLFANELYITVIRKTDTKGLAILQYWFKQFNKVASKESWNAELRAAHEELNETVSRIVSSLRNYSPKVLGIKKAKNGPCSEILTFLSKIVNPGLHIKDVLLTNTDIAKYIPLERIYFGHKVMEITGPIDNRYAGIVSLKEYGQYTNAGMLDTFLQLPFELIITQTYQFTNRQIAINKMQIQQNRMIQTSDKAISQVAEITRALDDAMSGRVAFGEHHLTILCIENSVKGLENALSLLESELQNNGLYPVREKINLEPTFWAQVPGNFDFIVRKGVISTLNFASFCSLHNFPLGKKSHNHWGEAVTVLDTTSGTPFFFSFHVRDVGHTTIIGPTGAGKTVLMNFLCAQAVKFNPRIFFFDKDQGAEIFIRALGGIYTAIEAHGGASFNPLQLDDTLQNRAFLAEWLQQLLQSNNEKISARDILTISGAIEGNFKLKKEDRILRNISAFLGIEGEESLASRLTMWHSDGSHARLFDNEKDKLDFSQSLIFGFEMGALLKDRYALAPVLLYLFHRINISLDGSPTIIVLDEAWALIDNPVFAPKIKDWLKVLRKLNAFVIFATQSVEDTTKSSISDTLIQQTATQIFLPNLKATDAYRTIFMLTQREYALIKNTDPGTRFFLVKQGVNAVVARLNLSNAEDIINILSGRVENTTVLNQIIKELKTNNPRVWIPIFHQRIKKNND